MLLNKMFLNYKACYFLVKLLKQIIEYAFRCMKFSGLSLSGTHLLFISPGMQQYITLENNSIKQTVGGCHRIKRSGN